MVTSDLNINIIQFTSNIADMLDEDEVADLIETKHKVSMYMDIEYLRGVAWQLQGRIDAYSDALFDTNSTPAQDKSYTDALLLIVVARKEILRKLESLA